MSKSALSPLLEGEIRQNGPMTVARFMEWALGHPEHGYYRKQDPFGKKGDFTTAPEISQMFGEMIGLSLADAWSRSAMPGKAVLAEIGPGRGTLMADALRAAKALPGFLQALHLHFIETSPVLRMAQKRAVPGTGLRGGPVWLDRVEDLPETGPLYLVANEFFDALPIHQIQNTPAGWRERLVTVNDAGELAFTLSGDPTPACDMVPVLPQPPHLDAIVEICPAALTIMDKLARRIATNGGCAFFIDYGPAKTATGDSLQAMMNHQYHPVLDNPGDADVTAHVDFERLCGVAKRAGAMVHGPITQGDWLSGLGIAMRAAALARKADQAMAKDIEQALHRLVHPDQMGQLFKVIAITGPNQPAPAGFPELTP